MTLPARISNISAWHLAGTAAIYIRQSTQRQVDHNVGSRAVQESLYQLVRDCGWPPERIRVFRDDLAKSGTSAANRSDFQELLGEIQSGEIRALFTQYDDRLARNTIDSLRLFNALRTARAFLYTNGRSTDMGNEAAADRFINTMFAALAQLENDSRVQRLGAARVQTAQLGFAVTRPPTGYVKATRGKWAMDGNLEVQRVVFLLWELAQKLRSLNEIVKHCEANNIRFPQYRKGQLRWVSVTRSRLYSLLTNPQYTGDFVYQKTKTTRDDEKGTRTVTPRPAEEWLRVPDHHPAYVSRDAWQAIQERLAERSPRVRPIVGRGNALLQGRIRCGVCLSWMRTQYSESDGGVRTGSYVCVKTDRDGKPAHQLFASARLIDRAVEQQALQALTPAEMETALDGIAQSLREQKTIQRSLENQLRSLEELSETLSQEYFAADPRSPRVRNMIKEKWEKALAEKERLERERNRSASPQRALSTADANALVKLTARAETLWRHPTITNADRKELLGTLISEIIVHGSNKETIELEVVWIGGLRQRLTVMRPRGVHLVIKEKFQEGKAPAAIARELREAGHRTAKGRPMTRVAVYTSLRQQGLLTPRARKIGVPAISTA